MAEAVRSARVIRFGTFEVDLPAGELRKSGVKLKLTGQPFQVLTILLERPGEVVTREELQTRLWPDTFVDVDHNLNTAINKIREVLGDSAESPRFVETLPRRGYRFIAATQGAAPAPGQGQSPSMPPARAAEVGFWHRSFAMIVLVAILLTGGVALLLVQKRSSPVTTPTEYRQLTNFTDSVVAPSLSPDGRILTFKRGEDAFFSSGQIYVQMLPDGEPVRLTHDADRKYAPVFSPDGSRIAYSNVSVTHSSTGPDTWTVPVLGGEPTLLLPNSSGLTWITDQRILFSEQKAASNMGIVTATQSRADRREVYFPADERAMAHYSYASPDRKSVLIVEMDQSHVFHQPCRLVPFDSSSAGRQVGPPGACTSAAWSPDGKWMYLGVMIGHHSHLWRQMFPDGKAEQITFGPSDEEGIAVAPDGHSLVTSVGTRRSSVWIHSPSGERAISSEGYAVAPYFSRDGRHVFYLFAKELALSAPLGWINWSGDLRSMDLISGNTESVLPGIPVADYNISPDEKEAVFTVSEGNGERTIWLADLDRRTPPRQIARAGDQASFDGDGDIIFRSLDEKAEGLVRIGKNGGQRERIADSPVLKVGVSPDGKSVLVFSFAVGEASPAMLALATHGGASRKVCTTWCWPAWSSDGRFFYVALPPGERTFVIPVPAGQSLPDLPPSGIDPSTKAADLRGASMIDHGLITPGPNPSEYVFLKTDLQRNLFQIPLH